MRRRHTNRRTVQNVASHLLDAYRIIRGAVSELSTLRPDQLLPALPKHLYGLGAFDRLALREAEKPRLRPSFVAASFSSA